MQYRLVVSIAMVSLSFAAGCIGGTGGGNGPTDGGDGVPCSGDVHGTPDEIASTPRSDPELELLALELSEQVVAPQSIYERVTRDISQIRESYDEVSGISYRPPHDGKSLNVGAADAETERAIKNGNFQEWECLNRHYEKRDVRHLVEGTFNVELKGIYDMKLVARDYQKFEGLEYAEPNFRGGDGPTICGERRGDVYHYVFDDASGDCRSGCSNHHYHYFSVDASGAVTEEGEWRDEQGNPPDWVTICGD